MLDIGQLIPVAHRHLNRALNGLMWPSAVAASLLVLPACWVLVDVLRLYWNSRALGLPLVAGMCLFALPWAVRRRLPRSGFWEVFEHEMTHILFALLTLHSVKSIQAVDAGSGRVSYQGDGNWLITVAPYFFPTVPLTAGIVVMALPGAAHPYGMVALGFTLAWHVVATLAELHPRQPDLQQVGLPFALAFIPGMSVLCIGLVLAIGVRGITGMPWFFARMAYRIGKIVS